MATASSKFSTGLFTGPQWQNLARENVKRN
jgi:hypothetical protein